MRAAAPVSLLFSDARRNNPLTGADIRMVDGWGDENGPRLLPPSQLPKALGDSCRGRPSGCGLQVSVYFSLFAPCHGISRSARFPPAAIFRVRRRAGCELKRLNIFVDAKQVPILQLKIFQIDCSNPIQIAERHEEVCHGFAEIASSVFECLPGCSPGNRPVCCETRYVGPGGNCAGASPCSDAIQSGIDLEEPDLILDIRQGTYIETLSFPSGGDYRRRTFDCGGSVIVDGSLTIQNGAADLNSGALTLQNQGLVPSPCRMWWAWKKTPRRTP